MRRDYLPSSPHFFRLLRLSTALFVVCVLLLAALIPAPLQEQADIGRVPNPAKSAWFLLWIQELVSYSKYLIYAVLGLAACFVCLPWLLPVDRERPAAWFPRGERPLQIVSLLAVAAIAALTVVAYFFRGKNWQLLAPF